MTQSTTPAAQDLNFGTKTVGTFGGDDDGIISGSTNALLETLNLNSSNDASGGGFDFSENTTGSLSFGLVPKFTVGGGATTVGYDLSLNGFTTTTDQSITTDFNTAGWSQTSASLSSTGFDPAQDSVGLNLVFDANNLSASAGETNDYPFIPNVNVSTPTVNLNFDDELISISPSVLPKGAVGLTVEYPGTEGAVTLSATLPDGAAVDDTLGAQSTIATLSGSNKTDDNILGVNVDLVAAMRAWATDKAKEGDVPAGELAAELNVIDGEIGSSSLNVHWTLGTVLLQGGISLGENVSFKPTSETVKYVTPYQTLTGKLGDDFKLANPAGQGSYTVNATYTIVGTLTSVLQAVLGVNLKLEMMTAGITIAGFSWDSDPLLSKDFPLDATPIDIATKSQTVTFTYTKSYTVTYNDPNPTYTAGATQVAGEYFGHPGKTVLLATTDPGNIVTLTSANPTTGSWNYDNTTGQITYTFANTTTDDDLQTLKFHIAHPGYVRSLDKTIKVLDLPVEQPTFTPYSPLNQTSKALTVYRDSPAYRDDNLSPGYFSLDLNNAYDSFKVEITGDSLFGLAGGEAVTTRSWVGLDRNKTVGDIYLGYTPGKYNGSSAFKTVADYQLNQSEWAADDTLTLTLHDLTTGIDYTGITDVVKVKFTKPILAGPNSEPEIIGPGGSAGIGQIEPYYNTSSNIYTIQLTGDTLFGASGGSSLSVDAQGNVTYHAGTYSVANATADQLRKGWIDDTLSFTMTDVLTGVTSTGTTGVSLDLKPPTFYQIYTDYNRRDVPLLPGGDTTAVMTVYSGNKTDPLAITLTDDYLFTTTSGSTKTTSSSLYISNGEVYFKAGPMPSTAKGDDTTDTVKFTLTDTVNGMSTSGYFNVNITPGDVPVANVASVEAYEKSIKDNFKFSVADLAANIIADLTALNSDSFVSAIAVDDFISADGATNDQANLSQAQTLVTSSKVRAFFVSDSAANILSAASSLLGNKLISAINVNGGATVDQAAKIKAVAKVHGFAIVDTAANVYAALIANTLQTYTTLSSISLTDATVAAPAAWSLTAAQYLASAGALAKIAPLTVTPASGATPAQTTGAYDLTVAGASVAQAAALQRDPNVAAFSVSDTRANVAASLAALNAETKLTSITLSDASGGALSIGYSSYVANSVALGLISGGVVVTGASSATAAALQGAAKVSSFTVVDKAANVVAALDALNGDAKLTAITLSDASSLTLTAAAAAQDAAALGKITNSPFSVSVVDSTAAIQSALGGFNLNIVKSIGFNDSSAPTLTLSYGLYRSASLLAALKAGGAKTISYQVTGTSIANAATINADKAVSSFTIADTAANVGKAFSSLSAYARLKSLHLTDAGTPTLTLTVAQATQMGSTLALIANASYAIAVTDSVANVAGGFDALNGLATLTSIALTGTGTPVLTLTAAQALNDTRALAALGSAKYGIAISDTAANIANNAAALAADAKISLIAPTGAATAQQAATLQGLGKLVRFTVQDTAANIADAGLAGDTKISAITATGAATVQQAAALQGLGKLASFAVQDTAANIATNAKALAKYIALSSITATGAATASQAATLQGLVKLASFVVQDTTANVTANLATLASATKLTSLKLSDAATLTLAYSTYSADNALVQRLAAQTGFFVVTGASAMQAAALQKSAGVKSFTVTDSAANVAANLAALIADTKLTAVAITGAGVQTLTVSVNNALTYATWLAAVGNARIAVSDTAANVAANLGKLAADSQIASIALAGSGVQTLTISVNNALTYATWLGAIGNAKIVVSDSSANVATNLAALAADSAVKAITLTGSGAQTLTVTAANALKYATWLAAIGNAKLVVSDTAANVVANLDKLAADSAVKAITLTDTGTLTLSVAQATGDTKALAEISNAYAITISDTANAVAAAASALNANGKVTAISLTAAASVAQASTLQGVNALASFNVQDSASAIGASLTALSGDAKIGTIGFTDASAPTLTLSVAQATQGAKALGKLTGAYSLKISDTAANVYADATALGAMSGSPVITLTTAATASQATALQGLSGLASFTVADTAAAVSSALDALSGDSHIQTIAFTDTGAPTLTLTAAQAINDAATLAKISTTTYSIALSGPATVAQAAVLQSVPRVASFNVADSAADILQSLDSLNGDAKLSSIAFTDAGPVTLRLTTAQQAQDANAISKFTGSNFTIRTIYPVNTDLTAAYIASSAQILIGDPTGGPITVTTAATAAEATILQGISRVATFNVEDSSANIFNPANGLAADSHIGAITVTDPETTVTLSAAQALADEPVLSRIANSGYQISISDSADDVVANLGSLQQLAQDGKIAAITLTDAGIPVLDLPLNLTNNDVRVINAITNTNFTIAIQDYAGTIYDDLIEFNGVLFTPGLSNPSAIGSVSLETAATAAQAATLDEFDLISSFDVADSAANVSADINALNADTKIASITLTDSPTPMLTLTVAEALDDTLTLGKIAGDDYLIDIVDTADHINAHSAALSANSHIAEINGVAVATWSGTGAATAIEALEALSTSGVAGQIHIADTAQNISNYFSSQEYFAAQGQEFNIDLTDSGTPTLSLSLAQYSDQSLLGDITNSSVNLVIDDTAANLYDDLIAANGGPGFAPPPSQFTVTAINCIGPATAQEAATLQNLGWINPFEVADTAAEVSDHFDALNSDTKVSSITLTDHDTPTLYLTVAQALNDTTALGEITNTNYQIFIVDTAADVAGAIDALNGDAKIASIALTDPGTPALNITPEQAQNDAATLQKITTGYTRFSLPPGPM